MDENLPNSAKEMIMRRPRDFEFVKDGKHPHQATAVLLPFETKVKSEPPGRDPTQVDRGVLREVIDVSEATASAPAGAAATEVLKVEQQRASGSGDRFKVQDVLSEGQNNVVQKEELETIELNSWGESSLVKLKRRIRLKLLAEEARNSLARKAELAALEGELPFPNTRSAAARNATSQVPAAKPQTFIKDGKPVIAPLTYKEPANGIVNLSSESEDEEKVIPERKPVIINKDHLGVTTNNAAFQRLLSPLLSAIDDSKDSPLMDMPSTIAGAAAAAAPPPPPRRPGRPAKKPSATSDLPAACRKVPESLSYLAKILKKGERGVADDGNSKLRQKSPKDRKEAAEEESAVEYEQERADNIRRNKEFLAQLGLTSTLQSMNAAQKSKRGRTLGSKNHVAAAEHYEKHHNLDEFLLRNRQILERRAAAAASAGKWPRLSDSELDDEEEEDDDVSDLGVGAKRQKKKQRWSKRTRNSMEQQELQRSIGRKSRKTMSVKASSSGGERGKNFKEIDKMPRGGRRRSIPASVINGLTASNQELIRFVRELMSSASSSLPQTLLRAAGTDAAAYDESDQDSENNRSNDESQHDDDSSPRTNGESARRRKDTWLTKIPFETPKTTYELERDEILRRHKDQFERLGIVSELIEEPPPPRAIRPYCRRWASEPDPVYQRNTRFKDRQRKSSTQPDAAALKDNIALTGTRSLLEVHSVSCASSLVAKFTGGCKLDTGHGTLGTPKAKLEVTDQEILGFRSEKGTWLDPDLTRIYTMDITPISGSSQKKALLAAAGSQGRLAVFAVSDGDPAPSSSDAPPPASVSKTPLLSWTVDSSWVSQVVFLSNQFQEHATLLLSSSNDGRVVLWDINKQRVRSGTRGLSPLTREGIPVVVCETSTLHNGGIFGMHESGGKIASSSEGSVAISTIKQTGIVMERSITGHHTGVIRSVRFREQNILADCGVDTVIGILDLRASDPCTLRIHSTHKTGPWLDTGWIPNVVQFEGHVHPRRVKCYSIYRPTFVAGGDAVVTPGEGTHQLSLYSVTTGFMIRKLHVGYDPNILLWNNVIPKHGGVWAGCRGITKFRAVWHQRGFD